MLSLLFNFDNSSDSAAPQTGLEGSIVYCCLGWSFCTWVVFGVSFLPNQVFGFDKACCGRFSFCIKFLFGHDLYWMNDFCIGNIKVAGECFLIMLAIMRIDLIYPVGLCLRNASKSLI